MGNTFQLFPSGQRTTVKCNSSCGSRLKEFQNLARHFHGRENGCSRNERRSWESPPYPQPKSASSPPTPCALAPPPRPATSSRTPQLPGWAQRWRDSTSPLWQPSSPKFHDFCVPAPSRHPSVGKGEAGSARFKGASKTKKNKNRGAPSTGHSIARGMGVAPKHPSSSLAQALGTTFISAVHPSSAKDAHASICSQGLCPELQMASTWPPAVQAASRPARPKTRSWPLPPLQASSRPTQPRVHL